MFFIIYLLSADIIQIIKRTVNLCAFRRINSTNYMLIIIFVCRVIQVLQFY